MTDIKRSDDRLIGIHQIEAYYGRSWYVIKRLIEDEAFPAIRGGPRGDQKGVWEASKSVVDEWERARYKKAPTE